MCRNVEFSPVSDGVGEEIPDPLIVHSQIFQVHVRFERRLLRTAADASREIASSIYSEVGILELGDAARSISCPVKLRRNSWLDVLMLPLPESVASP